MRNLLNVPLEKVGKNVHIISFNLLIFCEHIGEIN